VLILVCASNAFAWGEEGHRIVCRIAYDLLSPVEQKKVDALVNGFQTPPGTKLHIAGFPDACIFPDEARSQVRAAEKAHQLATSPWKRFDVFNNQHFLNVDRNVTTIPANACHDCVLTGIASQSALLRTAKNPQQRAEALIFLGHFVGDVHQPLHISYSDDEGGNSVEPVTGGFYPVPATPPGATKPATLNLHSVWDTSIIRRQLGTQKLNAFADGLKQKITDKQKTEWLQSIPLDWAQESYTITTSAHAEYCHKSAATCGRFGNGRVLGQAYQKEFEPQVDERLQKAGVRLAALIHEALKP